MIGDTNGARKGSENAPYGLDGSGVYVIDPPLGSVAMGSMGSRKSSLTPGSGNAYYEGGDDGSEAHRATPSDRNGGRVNLVTVDGHAEALTPGDLDFENAGDAVEALERGDDLEQVLLLVHGDDEVDQRVEALIRARVAERFPEHDVIGEEMVERLSRFIEAVVDMYHIDPQRIYLTGFSMGGDGVWALGKAHPEQFAALAPVSSWYRTGPQELCGLAVMPIWVFQSQADEIVSPRYAQQNVAQVQGCGSSQIKLSLFPSGGHEATSRQVYALDEFYQWFLGQK